MKFINGINRNQLPLFASSIDDAIAQDNEIRLIDLFVDSLKLADFGFTFDFVENRPKSIKTIFKSIGFVFWGSNTSS